MDSIQLSKLDNLLSRIDETNKIVFLKKDEELERITFQNLFEGVNFFQLCLRSQREVVFLNLHAVLELSPLVAKLVDDLRHCCLSPHDQVDICLDQFPPHLLNIFKNLLEKGECTVQSRDEEKQLETLIRAMGMDSRLELYRRIRVQKSPMNEKNRKRKSSGENSLREFKLRQCLDCKQPFRASQSHICLISLDSNKEDGQDELDKNGQDGKGENGMAVEITGPARENKVSKDGVDDKFEDEQHAFKTIEYESEDMACPRCGKVYKKGGANKVYFKRHVQSCLKRKYNQEEEIGINKNHDEKLVIDKNENQVDKVDSHTETHKQKRKTVVKSRESTLYDYVPKLKIHQKEPRNEKERKECPFCGKRYVIKGRGANRALSMYDIHVSKCDGGDYDISCVDPDVEPDEIIKDLIKDNKCSKCGKVYNAKGSAYHLKKHIEKCNIEFKECAKCGQNCNGECKECVKCEKVFKANAPVFQFQKHTHYCKGTTSIHDQKRKIVDSKSTDILQCEECNTIFVGYEAFSKHKQKCSEVKEKYPCRYGCGKEFTNEKLLKLHSWKWNCPVLNVSECQNMLCQLCGEEEFNEDGLYVHLYIRHEDLRRKIQKEITKKIARFYFMEKEKMNCVCPICGEEMRANRHSFGKHWAVQHKQIKKFYLSLSNNTHNNGAEYVEKESEHGDTDKIEIEDHEDDVSNDQELFKNKEISEGYNSQKTKERFFSSSHKLDNLAEEQLSEESSEIQDMEENDPQNIKSIPKMIIRNGWQIEMLREKSLTHESRSEEKEVIENESSPKIVGHVLGKENDVQEQSRTSHESRIEEKDTITEKLPTSVEYFENDSSSTAKSTIEEKDSISENSPTLSRLEIPPQILITNVREIENEKFQNQPSITDDFDVEKEHEPSITDDFEIEKEHEPSITDDFEIEKEHEPSITDDFEIEKEHEPSITDDFEIEKEHEPSITDGIENEKIKKQSLITHESGIEGVKLISDSRLKIANNDDIKSCDGEGWKDLNDRSSIGNEQLSESESDN